MKMEIIINLQINYQAKYAYWNYNYKQNKKLN